MVINGKNNEPFKEGLHGKWVILCILFLINFTANGVSMGALASLMPVIGKEMNLSYTQIGAVWSSAALGMVFFSLFGGSVADRYGVTPVLTVSLPIVAILMAARAFCGGFWSLTVVMFFIGVASSFIIPNLSKAVSLVFLPQELGRANGILTVGGISGLALAMMLAASVWSPWLGGWQNVMLLSGICILPMWFAWLFLARGLNRESFLHTAASGQNGGIKRSIISICRVRNFWLLCVVEMVAVGITQCMFGQIPSLLVARDMTVGNAGIFIGFFMFCCVIGTLIVPSLSDRAGNRKKFILPSFFLATPLIGIQGFLPPVLLFIALAATGICLGGIIPIVRTILMEHKEIGSVLAGTGIGGLFTVNRIGAFLFPLFMGQVVDIFLVPWSAFIFLAVMALAAGFTISFIQEDTATPPFRLEVAPLPVSDDYADS